jgi:hypothetical protein
MIMSRYKKLTALFIVLSIAYLLLTILLPVDKSTLHKYHISHAEDIILALTITIPYLIIWFIALVGCLRLRSYISTIFKSKDGAAFRTIGTGILWLTLWLPLSAIFSSISSGIYQSHPSAKPSMIIINNYVNIIILGVAFWFIHNGTSQLLRVIKKPASRMPQTLMMLFIAFASLYVFLVLRDPARQHATHDVSVAAYYLPDWLTITSVVIPRIIIWFWGIEAIYNIYLYRKWVKGPIYRNALYDLANGLTGVVLILVILRCLQSLSSLLEAWTLGVVLGFVFILLILLAIGYLLIARGAKSLQRIEEI